MKENTVLTMKPAGERFLSLDFFRGVIMIILLLGETGFFDKLDLAADNSFTHFLQLQFVHSEWRGLHFWDILLPAFMLIAGTSMAFSHHKQQQINFPRKKYFLKILKRSFWLFFWGVLIYSVRKNHLNFELSNVLVQLSVATLVASFVISSPAWLQLTVSLLCLLIPELLFRFSKVPGFDQPFSNQHNFGNYVDLILINRVNSPDTSTSMNAISGIAHVIWGVMAGQLLLSAKSNSLKFIYLTGAGVLAVIIGFLLDWTGVTPMLKWIASSSFVLATSGISLIALGICYEWIDVRKNRKHLQFFTIVGMNSIFIYLFFNFIGFKWLYGYLNILCSGLLNLLGVPISVGAVVSCLIAFGIEWYLCYFLYKKKIFFKL